MLAALFVVIALAVAVLASTVLSRAADPAVRSAGRFAPALGAAGFLSLRVLGFTATAYLLLAAGVVIAALVLSALYEHRFADAGDLRSHAAEAARSLRGQLRRL